MRSDNKRADRRDSTSCRTLPGRNRKDAESKQRGVHVDASAKRASRKSAFQVLKKKFNSPSDSNESETAKTGISEKSLISGKSKNKHRRDGRCDATKHKNKKKKQKKSKSLQGDLNSGSNMYHKNGSHGKLKNSRNKTKEKGKNNEKFEVTPKTASICESSRKVKKKRVRKYYTRNET